jgi:hypothetical protein
MKKDDAYSIAVKRIEDRLAAVQFDAAKPLTLTREAGFGTPVRHSFAKGSAVNQAVVRAAIQKLTAMGTAYKVVIQKSNARLESVYY